jgi:hypothetical protein
MKKMNLIALLLATMVLFSVKTSVAQNTTFKLSDYKNPDYFYQTLDLNFGLNNSLSLQKYNSESDDYNLNNYRFVGDVQLYFSNYANSLKSQSEMHASISGNLTNTSSLYARETYNSESKLNDFSHNESFNINGLKRFYNAKQNYFEVNGSLGLGYSGSSGKNRGYNADTLFGSNTNKNKNFRNSVSGSLLIGNGRIEQVQDARLALFLLDDLKRLNREKRLSSDEDVIELARLITSLKYKRFFDDRLRKIAEISAIDSFMQLKGIVSKTDAAYFTSLNDNWDFANNPVRNSGWRLYTGIEGRFDYFYSKNISEIIMPSPEFTERNDNRHGISAFAVAGLTHEKPISLKWQQSASIKAMIGTHFRQSETKITDSPDLNVYDGALPTVYLAANFGYGYYPNSRTWLTANWSLVSRFEKQYLGTTKEDKENSFNTYYTYTGPQVQAYYYLSEKLRLSLSFSGQFTVDSEKNIDTTPDGTDTKQTYTSYQQQLIATLTYSLF